MRRALAIAVLALLPLAACSDDDGGAIAADDETASTDEAEPTASTEDTTTTDDAATTDVTADEDTEMTVEQPTEVIVTTSGIDIRATEEQRSYGFGEPSDVVADVIAVLGEPTNEDAIPECPAGPADGVFWEDAGLQLVLQEGNLVGWTLAESSTIATDDALTIGSTLADLQLRHGEDNVVVDPESTLGIEFYVEGDGGLSGLLTEDTPEGTITAMWAGTVCNFR